MGCGLYPSLCLLNTCCDQNMTKVYSGTSVTGLVAKVIRAGEEVSDNYFPTAVYTPRQERRDWLAQHFMFHCECQACSENLPLGEDMPEHPERFICQKCSHPDLTKNESECPGCGERFDFVKQNDNVMNLVLAFNNCVRQYQCSQRADPMDYYLSLQDLYTKLRSTVSHPYKLLVFTEQQYLKAMKQVYGNKIMARK